MIGDGISNRAKAQFIAAVLFSKQVHQPLRTVTFRFVKIDPANR